MSINGAHVRILAAILLAGGAGFLIARGLDPHGGAPRQPVKEAHESEEHAKGFLALSETDATTAGVQLVRVERGSGLDLLLPGRVATPVGASSIVSSPLDGIVTQIHVAAGTRVARGGAVASIRSPEGGAIRADVDAAHAELEAAEALDARNRKLFDEGGISRQEWETTHAATLAAQAKLRAAEAQAAAMGSPDQSGLAIIRSPIAGIVTRIPVTPGSVLDDGLEIATIADQSRTELVFDAPPASLPQIAVGSRVAVQWTGGQPLEAEIVGVAPGASGGWATVRAQAKGTTPPLGAVVSGRLLGGPGNAITVPSEAVQRLDGVTNVFVAVEGGFRAVPVATGRSSNSRTEIIGGLKGDERVAASGAFLLKAELGKGEAEHDH
ncbi:MAG: efflux RND transporter periplasmic adaptor subunit [Hyphomonadaceae bacterium]